MKRVNDMPTEKEKVITYLEERVNFSNVHPRDDWVSVKVSVLEKALKYLKDEVREKQYPMDFEAAVRMILNGSEEPIYIEINNDSELNLNNLMPVYKLIPADMWITTRQTVDWFADGENNRKSFRLVDYGSLWRAWRDEPTAEDQESAKWIRRSDK